MEQPLEITEKNVLLELNDKNYSLFKKISQLSYSDKCELKKLLEKILSSDTAELKQKPIAMLYKALMLKNGHGYDKNVEEAKKLLEKLIEMKNGLAMALYAEIFGEEQNKSQAAKYYRMALHYTENDDYFRVAYSNLLDFSKHDHTIQQVITNDILVGKENPGSKVLHLKMDAEARYHVFMGLHEAKYLGPNKQDWHDVLHLSDRSRFDPDLRNLNQQNPPSRFSTFPFILEDAASLIVLLLNDILLNDSAKENFLLEISNEYQSRFKTTLLQQIDDCPNVIKRQQAYDVHGNYYLSKAAKDLSYSDTAKGLSSTIFLLQEIHPNCKFYSESLSMQSDILFKLITETLVTAQSFVEIFTSLKDVIKNLLQNDLKTIQRKIADGKDVEKNTQLLTNFNQSLARIDTGEIDILTHPTHDASTEEKHLKLCIDRINKLNKYTKDIKDFLQDLKTEISTTHFQIHKFNYYFGLFPTFGIPDGVEKISKLLSNLNDSDVNSLFDTYSKVFDIIQTKANEKSFFRKDLTGKFYSHNFITALEINEMKLDGLDSKAESILTIS